jgi:hypothetical protein
MAELTDLTPALDTAMATHGTSVEASEALATDLITYSACAHTLAYC